MGLKDACQSGTAAIFQFATSTVQLQKKTEGIENPVNFYQIFIKKYQNGALLVGLQCLCSRASNFSLNWNILSIYWWKTTNCTGTENFFMTEFCGMDLKLCGDCRSTCWQMVKCRRSLWPSVSWRASCQLSHFQVLVPRITSMELNFK